MAPLYAVCLIKPPVAKTGQNISAPIMTHYFNITGGISIVAVCLSYQLQPELAFRQGQDTPLNLVGKVHYWCVSHELRAGRRYFGGVRNSQQDDKPLILSHK
jgi:hypothetical protein